MKAEHWEKEKEFRQKTVQMQKDQSERLESLQVSKSSAPGKEGGGVNSVYKVHTQIHKQKVTKLGSRNSHLHKSD